VEDNDIILNIYNPGAEDLLTLRVKIPYKNYQAYNNDE